MTQTGPKSKRNPAAQHAAAPRTGPCLIRNFDPTFTVSKSLAGRYAMRFSQIKRRDFITLLGGAATWSLAARAQQRERVRRIAWLGAGRADEPSPYLESLRVGLRELGWTEGRNLTISQF